MSETKLKPCPFCGRPDPESGASRYIDAGRTITCRNPDCGVEMWDKTPELAARAWNSRFPEPSAAPEKSAP